jgi:uncharacterized phage protein (TIGR02218 family)
VKSLTPALLSFLQATNVFGRADLFDIGLINGQKLRTTSSQVDVPFGNLLLWSQVFGNSVWVKTNSGAGSVPAVVDNAIVAPDSTTTAATVAYPTVAAGVFASVSQTIPSSATLGVPLTFSVWLKAASGTPSIVLRGDTGTPQSDTTFVLTTSWKRYSCVVVPTGYGTAGVAMYSTNQAGFTAHVWGAQFEQNSSPSTYVATASKSIGGGVFYASRYGAWKRGAVKTKAGFDLSAGDMSLTMLAPQSVLMPGTSTSLSQCAALGLILASTVTVYTAYWDPSEAPNASRGCEVKFVGQVLDFQQAGRSKIEFRVGDLLYILNTKTPPHVIQAGCRHVLFDVNCALSSSGYVAGCTVATGSTRQTIVLASAVAAAPYYSLGYVIFTAGQNSGLEIGVKSQTSTTVIVLANPTPLPLAIGDTFYMYAGCDKTQSTCRNKFNNLINYGGQDYVPNPELGI